MAFKILVVDDSITIQKIVAMAFEKEDAFVEGIGNGKEALAKLIKYKPDIVLADVDMPGLNGFELSKKIKESKKFESVSVLLLTSDFEDFDENLFLESLADDHITKPFKSEDIVRKVMQLLEGDSISEPLENGENVIALSPTDRLEEDTVVEQGKKDAMNSPEGAAPDPEDEYLEISEDDLLINLENAEAEDLILELTEESEEDFDQNIQDLDAAVVADSSDAESDVEAPDEALVDEDSSNNMPEKNLDSAADSSPDAESEKAVPEETLEDLIRKVEALSKKSKEFHDQETQEKTLPMNTLDEMIHDVNTLKNNPSPVNSEGNGVGRPSPKVDEGNTLVAEVNYLSEENADELEAAFQEILNANKSYPSNFTALLPEEVPTPSEEEGLVSEAEALPEESMTASFADPFEDPPEPEEETAPESVGESQSQEENLENVGAFQGPEFQSSEDELLSHLMGKEVKEMIEQSVASSLEKELAVLSEKVMTSVEKIVREVVPDLTRTIVQQEIEKMKNPGKD